MSPWMTPAFTIKQTVQELSVTFESKPKKYPDRARSDHVMKCASWITALEWIIYSFAPSSCPQHNLKLWSVNRRCLHHALLGFQNVLQRRLGQRSLCQRCSSLGKQRHTWGPARFSSLVFTDHSAQFPFCTFRNRVLGHGGKLLFHFLRSQFGDVKNNLSYQLKNDPFWRGESPRKGFIPI